MRAAAARLAPPRPGGFALLLMAIAALGAGLVLARTTVDGVSVQGDSIPYVDVARSLLAGHGFMQWGEEGKPFVAWGPVWPTALALVSLGVFDPLDVAGPLNAACFGLTILVAGHWMRRRLASGFLAAWCCLAIAFSPLADYTLAVWSEPLFVLLATLSLYGTDRFLETGRRSSLLLAAGAAALACATRYLGLSLLPAALPLLALRPGAAPRERAKDIAIFMLIAALPLALWLLRNLLLTGTPAARRPAATASFSDHLQSVADVVAGWLPAVPGIPDAMVAAVLLTALGAVACAGFVRWLRRGGGAAPAPVAGAFAFSYVAGVVLAHTSVGLTPLGDRYLSPAYAPLLVLVVLAADRSLRLAGGVRLPFAAGPRVRALWRRAAFAALAAPLAFWAWQAAAADVPVAWDEATGSASRSWTVRQLEESSGIRWLRAHPADGRVFSNRRELVALFLDKDHASARVLPPELDTLLEEMRPSDRLVWFYDDFDPSEYDASDLRAALETEADTGTAAVFRFAEGSGEGPAATLEAEYASIAAREPEVRAHFDVYVAGRTLHWLREPCAPADIEPKFVLHLVPQDRGDLPRERQRSGFDNLDFLFRDRGARFGERCMASIALPDYAIARVRVGQWLPAEGRNLWQEHFAFAE